MSQSEHRSSVGPQPMIRRSTNGRSLAPTRVTPSGDASAGPLQPNDDGLDDAAARLARDVAERDAAQPRVARIAVGVNPALQPGDRALDLPAGHIHTQPIRDRL